MIITDEIILLILINVFICACGFKNVFWFISTCYGFSIAVTGVHLLLFYDANLNLTLVFAAAFLMCYGLRLSGYLIIRKLRSTSYNKKLSKEYEHHKTFKLSAKMSLWVGCSILYYLMAAPIIFRFVNNDGFDYFFLVGIIIAFIGLIIETVADAEKSISKIVDPDTFCDTGLYKYVRCPNYFGEMVIWTGVLITGFGTFCSFGQWIISILGYIGIIYIMFSGARRLELRQDRFYGNDKKFQKYAKKTPIILPFVPLYSVKKHKWLVG